MTIAYECEDVRQKLNIERNSSSPPPFYREYVRSNFVAKGMCADVCFHDKGDGNPHAHIMLTMRPMDGRGAWADAVNAEMERLGIGERVDHRSYERQGVEKIPSVHLGVAAAQMEQKGVRTERGDMNREAGRLNDLLKQIKARIAKLRDGLRKEKTAAKPGTLAAYVEGILADPGRWIQSGKGNAVKAAEHVQLFLAENEISTLRELKDVVSEMYQEQKGIRDQLSPIERRLKTLALHIRQGDAYEKHRPVYEQYASLKGRKQKKFREGHRAELEIYEAAERYLTPVLNGHALPLEKWKDEQTELYERQNEIRRRYAALNKKVEGAETIYFAAERLARAAKREAEREAQPQRKPREREWER